MPSLDVPTLSIILCLVYVTNGVLAALMVWAGRSFPGAAYWVTAQGLLAAGALVMALRPLMPEVLSIVFGNGLYLSSALVFFHAIWRFRLGKTFPWTLYLLIPVVFGSFAWAAGSPFAVRATLYCAWCLAGSAAGAILLCWRVERHYQLASFLAAMPFALVAIASAARLAWTWTGGRGDDFDHLSSGNALYLMAAVLTSTVTLFSYFLIVGIRAEQVVHRKDEQIESRNRKLMESGRSKDLFFSIIAHDLRGPIGGAARYVRKHLLGKMTGLEPKFHEVETVASALEKTNEFLEKLLWWARAQLQDWSPNVVPLDLTAVFEQARQLAQSGADTKEIPVEWPLAPFPKPLGDPESIQLILGNLLSNAVKFSLPGHAVRVSVEMMEGLCRIIVEDRGVGMDAATLDRLFRIEDKLTTHGTGGERGSGLGLILAQSLAERNHGGITMESEPGRGTRAILWLTMPNP